MLVNNGLEIVNVGWQLLHPDAKVPIYSSDEAAGADLHSIEKLTINSGQRCLVKTGIAIQLPAGVEAQVRPRSGLALKHGITVLNAPGTIDSDYRGEIGVILFNSSNWRTPFEIEVGDRIAQLVIAPVLRARFIAIGRFSITTRSTGGFGSTGVN